MPNRVAIPEFALDDPVAFRLRLTNFLNTVVWARTVAVSATYRAFFEDTALIADASSGAFTITLPTVVDGTNATYFIKKTDSSANAVTIDAAGSETIEGGANVALTKQNQSVIITSDGTTWHILASIGVAGALTATSIDVTGNLTVGGDITVTGDNLVLPLGDASSDTDPTLRFGPLNTGFYAVGTDELRGVVEGVRMFELQNAAKEVVKVYSPNLGFEVRSGETMDVQSLEFDLGALTTVVVRKASFRYNDMSDTTAEWQFRNITGTTNVVRLSSTAPADSVVLTTAGGVLIPGAIGSTASRVGGVFSTTGDFNGATTFGSSMTVTGNLNLTGNINLNGDVTQSAFDNGVAGAGRNITINRNSNATEPAAGAISLQRRAATDGGRQRHLWVDDTGLLRIHSSVPTTTASDTAGTVVGDQSSRIITKELTSDQTISSTTMAKVTGLDQAIGVGTWWFEYRVIWQTTNTATAIKLGVNFSGTQTRFVVEATGTEATTAASTGAMDQVDALFGLRSGGAGRAPSTTVSIFGPTSADTADADMMTVIKGVIKVTVAGDLQLYFGSEAGGSTQTCELGSALHLIQVSA